jgi:sugar lactone lactonase YvrE
MTKKPFIAKNGIVSNGPTTNSLGTVTGNATLDLSTGNVFEHTPTDNTTFVFSNPPASGTGYSFDLKITGTGEITKGFDLANATYNNVTLDISAQTIDSYSVAFNATGTKMFVAELSTRPKKVFQYNLSTPFDINSATYDSEVFDLWSGQNIYSIKFSPDGTLFYALDTAGGVIYEHTLTTPYDLSTASETGYFFDFAVSGLSFNSDGSKAYYIDNSTKTVKQYSTVNPYSVNSSTYDSVSFNLSSQISGEPIDLYFNEDGTAFFVSDSSFSVQKIFQYNLSTPFDLTTASYSNISYSVASLTTYLYGFTFSPTGQNFYFASVSYSGDVSTVYQFTSGESFAPSITYPNSVEWLDASAPADPADGEVLQLEFSTTDGGTTYYGAKKGAAARDKLGTVTGDATLDLSTGNVFEYSPSVTSATLAFSNAPADTFNQFSLLVDGYTVLGNAWKISTASYVQSLSVQAKDTSVEAVFFKPDGTKMYVLGSAGDDVNEYSLPTAWDISTAVYVQNFSVASQDTTPRGLFFKTDGTAMYIIGDTGNTIDRFNLSTAWDISTAVYSTSVSVPESNPTGLFFREDGLKLYIIGYSGDTVREYNLSTAWDISSLSYVQAFSVSAQDTVPMDLFFSADGTKMFVAGYTDGDINSYALSTAWDISTAVYDENFSVDSQDDRPTGLFFKPDGGTMYVIGGNQDTIVEYSVGSVQNLSITFPESVSGADNFPELAEGQSAYITFTTNDAGSTYSSSSYINGIGYVTTSTLKKYTTSAYISGEYNTTISIDTSLRDTWIHKFPPSLFTYAFTNPPAEGEVGTFNLIITSDNSSTTINWPASVDWAGGTAPDAPGNGETDVFTFVTVDGGTTWYGFQAGDAMS